MNKDPCIASVKQTTRLTVQTEQESRGPTEELNLILLGVWKEAKYVGRGEGRHVKISLFFFPLMTWDALRNYCTCATMTYEETKSGKEELAEL